MLFCECNKLVVKISDYLPKFCIYFYKLTRRKYMKKYQSDKLNGYNTGSFYDLHLRSLHFY